MTTISPSLSNKTKELHKRLMILEKFIELKSNECAYYRTKVHLMQMSSFNSQTIKKTSSENISHSSKHRTNSVPSSLQRKKNFNSSRVKERKTIAHNQNYFEDDSSPPNEKQSSIINNKKSTKDKDLLNQILMPYINKYFQQVDVHNKIIQCNEKDFYPIETLSLSKSAHTQLIIELPRRFVKSLIKQQKTSVTPKLKVHISSQLLYKLIQSMDKKNHHHKIDKFTIQSQFGTISACINHEDIQKSDIVHAKAEIKNHQLPTIRHIAQTDRKKNIHSISPKHRHFRAKKRHLHKLNSISHEEIYSKKSSLTNVTQSINTLSSSSD
ncbi:unnamed protein product [Adineta steineri]|uniref:Uncharacterized protein n=1 Tax=Adineta steineri TaxID=433720 RepID=A0A815FSU7_9BILA|nr:unnamed protein product [Adineta steineri]CAF1330409.1 unnamed protein product [Adineta steineri]CAF1568194.1 unnamed protein product [Adineta steineri]CAF1589357.1 unnamed protein product [Adineta steineri]